MLKQSSAKRSVEMSSESAVDVDVLSPVHSMSNKAGQGKKNIGFRASIALSSIQNQLGNAS